METGLYGKGTGEKKEGKERKKYATRSPNETRERDADEYFDGGNFQATSISTRIFRS